MMNNLIKQVEAACNPEAKIIPSFKSGDTINVHVKIQEGNKVRIQQFQGTVIQRRNTNSNGETFTVRKVSKGIGVERIFPMLSPSIGRPLPGRTSIILTHKSNYLLEKGCRVATRLADAFAIAKEGGEKELFIVGGSQIYKQTLDHADKIYLTQSHAKLPGDTFFRPLGDGWIVTKQTDYQADQENPYDYSFVELLPKRNIEKLS